MNVEEKLMISMILKGRKKFNPLQRQRQRKNEEQKQR